MNLNLNRPPIRGGVGNDSPDLAPSLPSHSQMASIRLPQTKGEIEAASAELLFAARHDVWSTNANSAGQRKDAHVKEDEIYRDGQLEGWFTRMSISGAMERRTLANRIEMTLYPYSEDIRKLGAKRVVAILGRQRWRSAQSAADFLAARS